MPDPIEGREPGSGPEGDSPPDRSRRRLRREVKWVLAAFVLVLVVEYLLVPRLTTARDHLHDLSSINLAYVVAGVLAEAAALVAYAQLTATVLPRGGPGRWRLLRIDLSSLALSHIVPGGTAAGIPVAYNLLTDAGVRGADAGFALAMQAVGSAAVLNVLFWLSLVASLFFHISNPAYLLAAGLGVLLMGAFASVILALTKGRTRSLGLLRRAAEPVPFIDGDRLAEAVGRVAERLASFGRDRSQRRAALGWASANWLLDAASLWVFLAAFHDYVSPISLVVAYGLANILAVIPFTPGGLGVIETTLIVTLSGFGVPKGDATLAVLGYRAANFWLPIPIGGAAYLSLRFPHRLRRRLAGTWHRATHTLRAPDRSGAEDQAATRGLGGTEGRTGTENHAEMQRLGGTGGGTGGGGGDGTIGSGRPGSTGLPP